MNVGGRTCVLIEDRLAVADRPVVDRMRADSPQDADRNRASIESGD